MRTFPSFAVTVEHRTRTVRLSGELDFAALPSLASLAASAPETGTIDLAAVTFLDATTLGFLVSTDNRLRAAGGSLNVVGTTASTRRIFALAGLLGLLADQVSQPVAATED